MSSEPTPKETDTMTETTTTAQRWTIKHFRPADMTEDVAATEAKAHLRDLIRDEGYVLDADSIEQLGASVAIQLDDEAAAGYAQWNGVGEPDGYITAWAASAHERYRDDEPVDVTPAGPTEVHAQVPAHITAVGGGVRVRHNLAGPVTVSAFAGALPTGYLFAQDIDENTEYVELLAGTTSLVVVADDVE